MREAVIVAATRTAVGRSNKGVTKNLRPDIMAAAVVKELLRQTKGKLDPALVDDFTLGCAFPEASQGVNLARPVAIMAGLPVSVPAQTINRFCSSGLQAIAIGAERIVAGGADVVVAGGVETMSLIPMTGFHASLSPWVVENHPEVYIGMGLTAERVADKYKVSREDQDEFAYHSHMKAVEAEKKGIFKKEILPLEWEEVSLSADGKQVRQKAVLERDEHIRPDTTVEVLSKLRPVFKNNGTVTPGNSSPLSDGAAGVILVEANMAAKLGLKPLLRFVRFSVAGVPPEIMGIGPIEAVPRVLKRAGMKLEQMELFELNEAFASQSLAVIRTLGLEPSILNVNGGAIALGHPLGCTGAKLTVQLMHEMRRRKNRYGMVTMCIGGGMGAAGIFENLN
jgi:acetyl-CoA acyltransferase